jgi:dimethylaniline monooxygenase (N-oxide forming)
MAMFSSLPMKHLPKDETYFDFFPAKHITQYLSDYVDQQIYRDCNLRQRIQFNTKVVKVEFSTATSMWKVFCHGRSQPLTATNLLVAAGLTSQPNMPQIPGQETFQGTLMHHVDFGKSSIMKEQEMKHIAVLGGAKSAADVTYAAAKAGKTISWIIRKSGSGPAHFAPAKGIGPYKNSNELLYTRLTASLTPSIWNSQNWLSGFWHGTRLGRKVVDFIWESFDFNARREAGFDEQRGVDISDNGLHNLEPDTSYVCKWTIPSRPC